MHTPQSGTDFSIDDWVEGRTAESGRITEFLAPPRRRVIWLWLCVAAAAAIGSALWPQITQQRFNTQVGELGHVELPDGSMAILNTDTKIELRFTGQTRLVKVPKGEALFDVAPDAHRIFIVEVGSFQFEVPANTSGVPRRNAARIGSLVDYARDIAVPLTPRTSHTLFATRGSTFTLRRRPDQTVELVVLEGSTDFRYGGRNLGRINQDTVVLFSAPRGLRLEMEPVKTFELEAKVAWLERRVVFAGNHTLREAATEFNRYNKVHILFEGRTGDRQIRGSFYVDQPNSFVETLELLSKAKHQVVSDHLITIQDADSATAIQERQ
jgi:transmembrane sensor